AGQNRNEDDVVHPQDDLEKRQGDERDGQFGHVSGVSCQFFRQKRTCSSAQPVASKYSILRRRRPVAIGTRSRADSCTFQRSITSLSSIQTRTPSSLVTESSKVPAGSCTIASARRTTLSLGRPGAS